MSWILDEPPDHLAGLTSIQPSEILLYYDGPAVFTAQIGPFETLFYKFDELDDSDLFLAVPLGKNTLALLMDGVLSIRGALQGDSAWVIEAESDLSILRTWSMSGSDIPATILPARRTGIRPGLRGVADTVAALSALFALSFEGDTLTRKGMPLSAFRTLVDNAYEAARRILVPQILAGTRSGTLDFEIAEPKFSSFVLALKQPLIDVAKVQKRVKQLRKHAGQAPDSDNIGDEIGANGAGFVRDIEEITDSAAKGEISAHLVEQSFTVLDRISSIVPSEQNKLTELEIASNVGGDRTSVVISIDEGEKILRVMSPTKALSSRSTESETP
jgi:hypothetical protein